MKLHNTILAAMSGLALAGCMTAADYQPIQAPATAEEAILDVRYSLRNPDAAEFRNVRTYASGGSGWTVVCGLVNGQNGYGGFTGFQPFRASVKPNGTVHAVYINDLPAVSAPCS